MSDKRGDDRLTPGDLCRVCECKNEREAGSFYCQFHTYGGFATTPVRPTEESRIISDHIKINIEQSAKGARVTVTYDRSDHDLEVAVHDAVVLYKSTLAELKNELLKVDES